MLIIAEEAYKTDTGRQRHANEDSYFARAPLFAVADGMGGAQAGEVASRIAAGAFEHGSAGEGPAEGRLEEIAQEANREIHKLAQEDSSRAGMGTTLTAAMLHDDEVAFGHVGDSRAYVLRDGELRRLTKDHSLVEELRRQGRLTEEQAEEHPQRSIITRALGPEPRVNVDTMSFPAHDGDVLLCSDGLTTMVSDEEIREILVGARGLRSAVNRLVDAANRGGGRDNITAVAFRVAEAGAEEVDEGATLMARTAEQAGLTGERVRAATDRLRGTGAPMPAPSRRRRAIRIAAVVAAVAVVVGGAFLIARSLYFLGTNDNGNVALYRGLPYELPLGIDLYSEQSSIPVQVGTLSEERQRAVTEHDLRGKGDATDLVTDIEQNEGAQQQAAQAAAAQQARQAAKQQQAAARKLKRAQGK
jgi:serine/threonine protein phosphatase PrpC